MNDYAMMGKEDIEHDMMYFDIILKFLHGTLANDINKCKHSSFHKETECCCWNTKAMNVSNQNISYTPK